jgi:hypothetical protein
MCQCSGSYFVEVLHLTAVQVKNVADQTPYVAPSESP